MRYADPDGVTYWRWPLNISQRTQFKWLAATTCMWLTFNSIPLPVISIMLQSQNTQAQQSQTLLNFTACFEFCAAKTVKLIPVISCSPALLVTLSSSWNCYKRVVGIWTKQTYVIIKYCNLLLSIIVFAWSFDSIWTMVLSTIVICWVLRFDNIIIIKEFECFWY